MDKHSKKAIIVSVTFIFIILIIISAMLINSFVHEYQKQQKIEYVYSKTSYDKVQDNLENSTDISDLYIKIDGYNVIGAIEIEKIGFKGLIYEGTTMDVLDQGIGHFTSTPIFSGNVCLAGHNYYGIWDKLYTLEKGDTIKYTSILGSNNYSVVSNEQILETDMSVLENTQNNMLTLITCVKNVPEKRLCVQAVSID
ncbi:MAG: class D sortase [Clostridia bacterium]|nr:class D sortase [Clostridia bacterium]MBP3800945.1 class D sortase [Clostridia bacterium]